MRLRSRRCGQDTQWFWIDSTSITSYAKGIGDVTWGHNKEGDKARQLNMVVVYGFTSGLSVRYMKLAGGLPDSRSLRLLREEMISAGTPPAGYVFDIEQILSGLVYKAGAWRNSHARETMEDWILKRWLDSEADDKSQLRSALSVLSDAAGKFAFADTCHAAGQLIAKGHFPSREAMESCCLRMRECGEGFSMNTTGVMLSMYDMPPGQGGQLMGRMSTSMA